MSLFELSSSVIFGQLLVGLINGSFYALLSLGLAVIFGMLRVINFAHGAQYMLGAFVAWLVLRYAGIGYFPSLVIAPLVVGLAGSFIERKFLARVYALNHLYGLLLTLGIALICEGAMQYKYGSAGLPYSTPPVLSGAIDIGFMIVPIYRGWVVVASLVICIATWFLVERTKFGSYLRASTESPVLVQAFGVNVPRLMTLTYALGAGLAALAGVMAAPVYQVSPLMGQNIIIVVFAVVVVGGMGSIAGAIITGYGLGILEGLSKVVYPEASNIVVFALMALVLLLRPSGIFGRDEGLAGAAAGVDTQDSGYVLSPRMTRYLGMAGLLVLVLVPYIIYPTFAMKVLCFALFACAVNLLLGFTGLLSFGHAAFFGGASYITAYSLKVLGLTPEIGLLVGTLGAAALGLLFGFLAIRRQGIYFAMVTLALAQMFYFFCLQTPFTGGEDGLQAVPRGKLFGWIDLAETTTLYYFAAIVFVLGYISIRRIVHSPFGNILKAIRENERRAISLGYRTERYKLAVFVISAAIAGLAGGLKAIIFQFATLNDVTWQMSGEPILMTLLGGIGTLFGPVVGAILILSVENYLADSGLPVSVVMGLLFVLVVMVFRRGAVGELLVYAKRWRGWLDQRGAGRMLQRQQGLSVPPDPVS